MVICFPPLVEGRPGAGSAPLIEIQPGGVSRVADAARRRSARVERPLLRRAGRRGAGTGAIGARRRPSRRGHGAPCGAREVVTVLAFTAARRQHGDGLLPVWLLRPVASMRGPSCERVGLG
jgi:hypothetical protein